MGSHAVSELDHTGHDPILLQALARVNAIGASINRISWGDTAGVDATLRLIVESAIAMAPGASAVIYAYDETRQALDPVSRVAAGPHAAPLLTDAPRADGLGARAIRQRRPVLSYEEPDLEIHPTQRAAGAEIVICLPLVVADQPLGVLYVYLHEDRRLSRIELLLLDNFVNQAAMALYHAGRFTDAQRSLARKEDELALLRHAGLLISSRSSLEATLNAILQMALEVTGARYGIFRLVDRAGQNLVMRAIAGEHLGRPAVEALPINATSVMGWVAKTRQPLNIADVSAPPWSRIYYPLDHALQMRAELAVPLVGAGGRLEGVLNLESPLVGAFSEADSHLLQGLATQAVIAIQDVRLLDVLQEMAGHLLTQPAPQVLEHLVALASDLLGGAASAIWLLDEEALTLQAASAGHVRGDKLSLHGSLTGQAILTRASVISEDVRAEPRFGWPDLARTQGWTRALIVPLIAAEGSEPVGAFSVYGSTADEDRFTASDWDKKVLGILAHYAALAVRNAANQTALRSAQEQHATAETFAAVGDVAANLLHRLNNKVGTIPVRVEGIEDKCAAALAADPYLAEQPGRDRAQRARSDGSRPRKPVSPPTAAAGAGQRGGLRGRGPDGQPPPRGSARGANGPRRSAGRDRASERAGAGLHQLAGERRRRHGRRRSGDDPGRHAPRRGRDHRERQRARDRARAARAHFRAQLLGQAEGARR